MTKTKQTVVTVTTLALPFQRPVTLKKRSRRTIYHRKDGVEMVVFGGHLTPVRRECGLPVLKLFPRLIKVDDKRGPLVFEAVRIAG